MKIGFSDRSTAFDTFIIEEIVFLLSGRLALRQIKHCGKIEERF